MVVYTLVKSGLLCLAYLLIFTENVYAGNPLISAQCRARCLVDAWKHKQATGKTNNRITVEKCLKNNRCQACERPCGYQLDTFDHCQTLCRENEDQCIESCHFLESIYLHKAGECLPPDQVAGFDAACVEACDKDGDCPELKKCCSNGCGRTCQRPVLDLINLPTIASRPRIIERRKSMSKTVDLEWVDVGNYSEPVLYVVEAKWHAGKDFNEEFMTDWVQIALTTRPIATVREVDAGKWYMFRVAAVSINGSMGFSPSTDPFQLSEEPRVPSPPQNLSEDVTTIHDGGVDVKIKWQPPAKTDLPVDKYKVFWSKRLKGVTASLTFIEQFKKVVDGTELTFTLKNLEPDATYFVQVQAVCHYDEERLRSDSASTYILTPPVFQNTQHASPPPVDFAKVGPTPGPLRNVTVGKPYFQNGLLKATVFWLKPLGFAKDVDKYLLHWTPEVCLADVKNNDEPYSRTISATTHATELENEKFDVYDLRFDCRYNVKVEPVNSNGIQGPVSHVQFYTPSCTDVLVVGKTQPDCPTNAPNVPQQPVDLVSKFLITNRNITALITWKEPYSDRPITGYRIVWGSRLEEPSGFPSFHNRDLPIIDKNTELTKVIPRSTRQFSIPMLKEGTDYMVQVQAMSDIGPGTKEQVYFTTPQLTLFKVGRSRDPIEGDDNTAEDNVYRHLETKDPVKEGTSAATKSTGSIACFLFPLLISIVTL
ncbi:anosmin-1-like isoform X2 [Lineus longissimus]|uniref:anosmin-1-like isoform X2 n=1 Tax=Lineus longissimus TaxID=88925 RepID=UPI00315C95D4